MTPDLTNPYHRAYAEVFGLADVQADEWPEIEAQMQSVAEAPTADHAAYLLAGWGYHDRHGDADAAALTAAARDIRRRLGVVDAPEPGSVDAILTRWSGALAALAEGPTGYGDHDVEALAATTERLAAEVVRLRQALDAAEAIARGAHREAP